MRSRGRALLALVLVATLVVQAAGVGVVGAQSRVEGSVDAADEIYVDENGDAVLVYENPGSEPDAPNAEFGTSVAENLAYFLITDPVEETPDVRGNLDLAASGDSLTGDGALSFPKPDALSVFSLQANSTSTADTARSDFSLSATVRDTSGASALLSSAETTGEMTTAGDRFGLTADLDARLNVPLGQSQSFDATLTESGEGYDLSVDWTRPVSPRVAEAWRNESVARQRLQKQFAAVAASVGGTATVDVEEVGVSDDGSQPTLRQAYTVTLTGVDDELEQVVRQTLSENPDLSAEQVDRLASGIADVQVDEAHLDYAVDGRDVTGEVRLEVTGFSDLTLAYFELAESLEAGGGFGADVEQLRAQFEAQQAANLQQTVSWEARIAQGEEDGTVTVDVDAGLRSTNWAAYVDELQSRDVPFVASTFDLTGAIANGRVEFDGSASLTGDRLFEQFLDGLPGEDEAPPEVAAVLGALRDSNPERAGFSASYDGDGLRIEGAAEFGNLAALRDGLRETGDLPAASSVVGHADESGSSVYVRVPGAVSGDATESAVRGLAYVDGETTVHLPGEWDREFPTMDADRARSYLDDVTSGSDGPGFGAVAAVVALAAAAFLFARRD